MYDPPEPPEPDDADYRAWQERQARPSLIRVIPAFDPAVRELCRRPYPLHPKGCPNFGKRPSCPPAAPLYGDFYDLSQPVYAVVNDFNLANHVAKMRAAHPDWSEAQLRCCLYWQPTARSQLAMKINAALASLSGYHAETCPEAMGINVTLTLRLVGIELEWPPLCIARQVALLAVPLPAIHCTKHEHFCLQGE